MAHIFFSMLIFEMSEMEQNIKNKQHSLEKKFLDFISKEKLWGEKDDLLLAISGGKDSVSLFHLLLHHKIKFTCAHVNFKLRDTESDDDEKFVKALCKKHHIELHITSFNTRAKAKSEKISTQMAARDLRYNWFNDLLQAHHYKKILVAHHLLDNTETILLNLVRGTSIEGLTGLRISAHNIVRPLMFADIVEIESYLQYYKYKFREDSSNATTKYKRNSIRHKVIPELLKLNPNLNQTVFDNAQHLKNIQSFMMESFMSFQQYFILKENDSQILNIHSAIPEFFLRQWLKPYGFNATQTKEAFRLLNSESGKQILSKTHRIAKNRQQLILSKILNPSLDKITFHTIEDLINHPDFNVEIISKQQLKSLKVEKDTALFDLDKIKFPLVIDQKYTEEKFIPLGLKHFVKVSDFLIQNKVSSFKKTKVTLLKQGKDIIWLINYRSDNRFKVNEATHTILKISTK
jgi:tRNA(Ile)-lysidine synthase